MFTIQFTTVLIVSAIAFVIQFIINGPLFAKFYMKLAGKTEQPVMISKLPLRLACNFLANIFTVYGVAMVYMLATTSSYFTQSIGHGILCGIFVWLAFLVPASAVDVIWNGKRVGLWLFEVAASLIVLSAMGMFIALLG